MSSLHFKYVLVGGGGAGSAAAQAIRLHDRAGSILLVGQEHSRPYLRPALSKDYLLRRQTRIQIVSEPVGWYVQQQVELRTGRRVGQLDTARRMIHLDDGDEIAFDALLIATGASPKPLHIPGAELPNVFYLRTIDDCDRLHHAIDKAKWEGRPQPRSQGSVSGAKGKVVVIGSGLLAVEAAAAFKQSGLHVDLLVGSAHPWARVAGESTGRFISRYLEGRGIVVHAGATADRIDGDGRVQRVLLSDGKAIDCDFLVAALGIVPNRELVRGTPISAEKAILVDDRCQTNIEGIYSAGDCAAIFDPLFEKHRILEHWDSARLVGAIAGSNMAGVEAHYTGVNSFNSRIFDLNLIGWGERRLVDRRLVRGTPSVDSLDFAEIGVAADGRVAQVLAIGRDAEHASLQKLVQLRFNVTGHEEMLKDPNWDLHQTID